MSAFGRVQTSKKSRRAQASSPLHTAGRLCLARSLAPRRRSPPAQRIYAPRRRPSSFFLFSTLAVCCAPSAGLFIPLSRQHTHRIDAVNLSQLLHAARRGAAARRRLAGRRPEQRLCQPRRPARRAGRLVRRPDGGGRDLRADKLVGYLASHRFVVRLLRALGLVLEGFVLEEPRLQPGLPQLQQRY